MIIYQTTVGGFCDSILDTELVDDLEKQFHKHYGHGVSPSERRSWENSLNAMDKVLRRSRIPEDFGVALEYGVPQTSKRIDFLISGYDENHHPSLIVVELKQWSTSEVAEEDGLLLAVRGGHRGPTKGPHPSYQAWSYVELIKNFNENVYNQSIDLQPCAYLHNHHTDNHPAVCDERYKVYLNKAPVFLKGLPELMKLGQFIKKHIKTGDRGKLFEVLENGRMRPSKPLADVVKNILDGKREFVLIDEQKVAYETIYAKVKSVLKDKEKSKSVSKEVIIVRGGPGTGKSVIAVNLLSRLTGDQIMCAYVSKNAAPRAVYQQRMKGGNYRASAIRHLFQGSGAFVDSPKDFYDVLLADEAHRLNEKSGLYGVDGENQILEIIRSSRVSVFFIDENQRVTMKDIGTEDEIKKHAKACSANITFCDLVSQFRCNGSQAYVDWVDDVLDISKNNHSHDELGLDVRIFDTAQAMHDAIKAREAEAKSARVVAGYCWNWVSKKKDEYDIVLDDGAYQKKWNLSSYGSLWAIESKVDEIGCIHTCQGLEFDYIGVIIGPDLIVRDDRVLTDGNARASTDQSLKGWKTQLKTDRQATLKRVDEIIKNTYRTLLTRGMKGCYIYCEDEETREYFKSKLKIR